MGLAHAYHATLAGLRVAVFERDGIANGASTRNFGMLAILAQADGKQLDDAHRSLQTWQRIAIEAGVDLKHCGCLIVAKHQTELAVLEEYATANRSRSSSTLLNASELDPIVPGLKTDDIVGALWSDDAWKVDQRQATIQIAHWLHREHGVEFHFSSNVTNVEPGKVTTANDTFTCASVIVCAGDDFSTLFPAEFAASGVNTCQLQMLRTQPQPTDWTLNPFLLGGLSLPRYSSFSECPSLPELKEMQQNHYPECLKHGIHIIASQETDGSITIGDSHQYTNDINPERLSIIDRLIQDELSTMLSLPNQTVARRWCGRYAYLPDTDKLTLRIADGVFATTMTNGQGMTHAFAQAEALVKEVTA